MTEITDKSKLIVNYNQLAIVLYKNKVEKVFGGGTHEVNGDTFSFIPGIGMRSRDGESFGVEVYFFNKDIKLDMLWGTRDPLLVTDLNTGNEIRLRARGKFKISVDSFPNIISKLLYKTTKNNLLEHNKLAMYLRELIVDSLNNALIDYTFKNRNALLKIESHSSELEGLITPSLQTQFKNFGLKLDSFNIDSINVYDQDISKLKEINEVKVDVPTTKVEEPKKDFSNLSNPNFSGFSKSISIDPTIIKTKENKEKLECPKCGKHSDANAYCPYCGSPMKLRCVLCNHELAKDDEFCPKCNTRVNR